MGAEENTSPGIPDELPGHPEPADNSGRPSALGSYTLSSGGNVILQRMSADGMLIGEPVRTAGRVVFDPATLPADQPSLAEFVRAWQDTVGFVAPELLAEKIEQFCNDLVELYGDHDE